MFRTSTGKDIRLKMPENTCQGLKVWLAKRMSVKTKKRELGIFVKETEIIIINSEGMFLMQSNSQP
jgi:hypothetical protein